MPRLADARAEAIVQVKAANPKISKAAAYRQVVKCAPLTSYSASSDLFRQPEVRERLTELLQLVNPPEDIANDLRDARRANKYISHDGKLLEKPDHAVRMQAVEHILHYGYPQPAQPLVDALSLTYQVSGDPAQLAAVLERLEKLSAQLNPLPVPATVALPLHKKSTQGKK